MISALIGGMFIGLAATILLLLEGRIAGISGIAGGLVPGRRGDRLWRAIFVGGLLAGGVVAGLLLPGAFSVGIERSVGVVIAAGLLVGFGTQLGSGCTSGHGVCGVSRMSRRSLVATGTFMFFGIATTYVHQHLLGGVP